MGVRCIPCLFALLTVSLAVAADVDPKLPAYQPASGVMGTIKVEGSDTMLQLMSTWAESFKKLHPDIQIEIAGKGSSTAPPALTSGAANFGPMSREMKSSEIDAFEKKFGYKPTALPVAIDMLAIYVHKDNPIESLTLQQVDAIFSKSRKAGGAKDITTWGDLGLKGEWADKPIGLYGRNAASGTYGFLKEIVLKGGDYKDSVKEQPGSSAVVQGVANDKFGIGYSGIGYKTDGVKAVALSAKPKAKPVEADPENAYTGKYPLSRFLLVYINYDAQTRIDPLRAAFIRYMFSFEGQKAVAKEGYFPVSNVIAQRTLKQVGLAK